jgi:hypothetical protein
VAVEGRDLTMDASQRLGDEDIDFAEQMAGANALFQMERIEELRLVVLLTPHHRCVSPQILRRTESRPSRRHNSSPASSRSCQWTLKADSGLRSLNISVRPTRLTKQIFFPGRACKITFDACAKGESSGSLMMSSPPPTNPGCSWLHSNREPLTIQSFA